MLFQEQRNFGYVKNNPAYDNMLHLWRVDTEKTWTVCTADLGDKIFWEELMERTMFEGIWIRRTNEELSRMYNDMIRIL